MKKIISLLLVLILCLAFAACKKDDAKTDGAEEDSAEPAIATEPVSTYPDNLNDGSVPSEEDLYRADLNQLALVESRIHVAPVHVKIEKLDNKFRIDVYNDTDAPIKNVNVAFVGLTENGTLVTVGNSMSIVVGTKASVDYAQSYTAKDEIAANDFFEVTIASKTNDYDRVTSIVASYETNNTTVENDDMKAWTEAVFYSDFRKLGSKETPKEDETLYYIDDVDAVKAAAAEPFDIMIEEGKRYYNGSPDRISLTLTNGTQSEIKSMELYSIGIRKDHSRVEIDRSTSEFAIPALSLYAIDRSPINCVKGHVLELEEGLPVGESVDSSLSVNFAAWSDYSIIVASYTTDDGTVVKNPAAAQWLSAVTNGEVSQAAED